MAVAVESKLVWAIFLFAIYPKTIRVLTERSRKSRLSLGKIPQTEPVCFTFLPITNFL
jgi:hypothetical protein